MGQRLNIEIVSGDTSLANCYYHWSAYTHPALMLTKKIVDSYYDSEESNELKMAVELLEITGGGVNEAERKEIEKQYNKFGYLRLKDCVNRNEGLISVTEQGKGETRNWEEGRVTIDLNAETICFDLLFNDTVEDYSEYYDENFNEGSFEKLPECLYDFANIPFECVDDVINFVESNALARDEDSVIHWIE